MNDIRRLWIGLQAAILCAAGCFAGSYGLAVLASEAPKAGGLEAFFGISSGLAFLAGVVCVIVFFIIGYLLVFED